MKGAIQIKVLVACEESQTVCKAFRERGHEAFSCDVQNNSGGVDAWHIQANCLPLINGNCEFRTVDGLWHSIDGEWDLIIAHPPCTYLTVSGNRWFSEDNYHSNAIGRYMDRVSAIDFFMRFVYCNAKRLAIENPIGVMSNVYRKPNQIIQPYEFGHPNKKSTCLWLRNLPNLKPTDIVKPNLVRCADGKLYDAELAACPKDENGKTVPFNDPRCAKIRSKTFEGIAKAMADQWG